MKLYWFLWIFFFPQKKCLLKKKNYLLSNLIMFQNSLLRRSCTHLTGYAVFAKSAFKMPVMETVPGGFKNKNLVSHDAWNKLGPNGRTHYSEEGKRFSISQIKRQRTKALALKRKARSSFLFHSIDHPGWRKFVHDNYKNEEIQKLPFKQRLDALANLHEAHLRNQRRIHNLELRQQAKNKKKLASEKKLKKKN
jgi:hypothetical protein